jgi:polyisoprenoid-binding protein YceI
MNKFRWASLAMGVVLAAGAAAGAQVKEYKIDPNHSEADFSIKHLVVSTVHGAFHGVNGVVRLDPNDLTKSRVEATVDVSTVDTGVGSRDTHLKTTDFFNVAQYPTMTFTSTSVKKAGDYYDVTGDLTMHGVTKQVVLRVEAPSKSIADAKGREHRGFTATTSINRQDFGMKYQGTTPGGEQVLGDDVKIEIDIDAAA